MPGGPKQMTSRELWLAALRLEPVDRVPFWPKIDGAYARAQDPPFRDMSMPELHDFFGSDRHQWVRSCVREIRTRTSTEETYGDITRTVYRTPSGTTAAARRYDPVSTSQHPIEFPIRTLDDLRVMTEWYADVTCEPDSEALEASHAVQAELGERGSTAEGIGTTPIMHFVQWLAGVENAHLMLADYPDEVEALFEAMRQALLSTMRVAAEHSPADTLYLVENTSTTLMSPQQFRRYCLPIIEECGRIARDYGRILVLHMCGHLRDLLPDLGTVPAHGFEAYSTPTVGNATLLEGRQTCPNVCFIGGTNANTWTRPADEIISEIRRNLDELPSHRGIVLTSGGVMPPACKPETIREVCRWLKTYPVRM